MTILDYLLPGRRILTVLKLVLEKENAIMAALDDLLAAQQVTLQKIADNTSLDASIKALVEAQKSQIADLIAQVAAAGTDPAKLATALSNAKAINDAVDADTAASAVLESTPAAPTA